MDSGKENREKGIAQFCHQVVSYRVHCPPTSWRKLCIPMLENLVLAWTRYQELRSIAAEMLAIWETTTYIMQLELREIEKL